MSDNYLDSCEYLCNEDETMTDKEINLAIAEKKGFKLKRINGIIMFWEEETGPHLDPGWSPFLVDYVNDPARILELAIELIDARWQPIKAGDGEREWIDHNNSGNGLIVCERDEHFGKSTALAYVKMKGIECEPHTT